MSTESTTARIEAATIKRAKINAQPWSGADGGASGFEYVVTVEFAHELGRELDEANRKLEVAKESLQLCSDANGWLDFNHLDAVRAGSVKLSGDAIRDMSYIQTALSKAQQALATINQKETK